MPYLVHSTTDRQEMLDALGARSLDDLLVDVPTGLRLELALSTGDRRHQCDCPSVRAR